MLCFIAQVHRKVAKGHLTVSELQASERHLVIYEQQQAFGHFISRIPEGLNVYASSIPAALRKLNPIVIQGILRVGGRLEKASIDSDARHPIILPHVSHLTDIIINHFHVFSGHSGISTTLNSLFQQFWVVKPTSVVKRVLANCMYCRRRNAKTGEPIMAELPPARLKMNSHPIAYTDVDYFGPLMIRQKRSNVKRYGCLFTCLTTRAVHLEVSVDLSSDAFVNALRRFLSRRGPVVHIYSDNATNLVGAERILRESIQQWNQHQIHNFLSPFFRASPVIRIVKLFTQHVVRGDYWVPTNCSLTVNGGVASLIAWLDHSCQKTEVGGKQGHAPCRRILLQ